MSGNESFVDSEHEKVVFWLAHFMTSEYGYKITHMAHPKQSYPWPPIVNGYLPDILGEKVEDETVKHAIGKAESYAGIVSKDAYAQIEAFKSSTSQYEFFFGVPSRGLVRAKYLFIDVLFGENEQNHLCHFDV